MMESTSPDIDLKSKDSFCFWTPVSIRFSDQDPLGHINNVAYAAYIEAGRTMFIGGLLDADKHPDIDFVLAKVTIDYIKEAYYPGTVDVGTRVIRVGNKSITTGYGVFVGDDCVATSESVNVFFNPKKHHSVAIPEDVKAALQADPLLKKHSRRYARDY
tara:strand:- start:12148 stop:12624 length:477 start_codon:yes stop_codon:yes gene_type:complete